MGTYTATYNLFLPSIGEQGWGELVNGNFTTIDTTMKGLDTRMGTAETNISSLTTRMGTAETTITSNKSRIGTLETEADTLDSRLAALEQEITFDSYGIVGNLSGKINVLSLSSDSNNLLMCEVSAPSASKFLGTTATGSFTIQPGSVDKKYNTGLFNYVLSDAEYLLFCEVDCDISMPNPNTNSLTGSVTVSYDGTTIYSETKTMPAGSTTKWTFSRNLGKVYTVDFNAGKWHSSCSASAVSSKLYLSQ